MKRKLNEMVIYQIYPRSFQDSNGDGIGDLNGIRNRLDYLNKLGVDMIWITPFYPSGGKDNGYDIKNYCAIDPLFGTMADFKALVQEAKALDIGIMLDMVLNHTSTLHPWFQKALEGDEEFMDYYFFKDKPTNWESKFGGNAWEYVPHLNKYYLHLFDTMQADLNWENKKVREEAINIVKFWMDLGVEGFRFDVINLISKPKTFEDATVGDGRDLYTDGPKVLEYLQELNRKSFGENNAVTVGELSSTTVQNAAKYVNPKNKGLSTAFGFHHLKIDYKDNKKWYLQKPDYASLKEILRDWQDTMEENDAVMALFWNNHDQPRSISRLGDEINYPYESATMIASMMHLLKGMPYIYQGEEIGLPNAYFKDMDDYKDIESINMRRILSESFSEEDVRKRLATHSRDNGRTPIPWDNSTNYGFSTSKPWIKFSQHPHLQTVDDELKKEDSIFSWYQDLINLRHNNKLVSEGTVKWLDGVDTSFHFKRILDKQEMLVLNNLGSIEIEFTLDKKYNKIILSNYHRKVIEDKIVLKPFETLVLQ